LPFLLLCSLKADAKILDNKHSFFPIELTMTTISLEIDTDVAKIYQDFTPQRQQQIQLLFNLILKRTLEEDTLENIVTDIRKQAKTNGLTPEILEKLLEND
jgi:hypothetical protein